MAAFPGTYQNFYKPPDLPGKPNITSPLSSETINQQAFPYHTFVVVNSKIGAIEKQHTLVLNPQDFQQREPVRAQIVQTIGGAYVDDFGRGLPRVTISGNSGWRLKQTPDGKALLDGWQAFKTLRNDIFRYFTDAKDEARTFIRNPDVALHWYNWGEDEYYEIQPEEFQLQRSASNPLLFQYTFPFTCLRDLRASWQTGSNGPTVFKLGATTSIKDAVSSISTSVTNLGALAATMTQ